MTKTQAQMEHEVSAFTRVLECVCGLRIDSTCLIWGQLAELGSGLPESRDKNALGHIQCVCVCVRACICVYYILLNLHELFFYPFTAIPYIHLILVCRSPTLYPMALDPM